MINGCNARCLSHVTGLSAHAEASPRTRTFDMVGAIRQRRHRWLGHILRMPDERLVKEAIRVQFKMQTPGNIFMDVPPNVSFRQLEIMARDRKQWKADLPVLAQKSVMDMQDEYDEFQRQYRIQHPSQFQQSLAAITTTHSPQQHLPADPDPEQIQALIEHYNITKLPQHLLQQFTQQFPLPSFNITPNNHNTGTDSEHTE